MATKNSEQQKRVDARLQEYKNLVIDAGNPKYQDGFSLIELLISKIDEQSKRLDNFIYSIINKIQTFKGENAAKNVMEGFTNHNIGHAFIVMGYMYALIPNKNTIGVLDLFYLITSALCHDLMMMTVVDGESGDLTNIKKNSFLGETTNDINDQKRRYCWEKVKEDVKRNNPTLKLEDCENETFRIIIRGLHFERRIVSKKIKYLLGAEDDLLRDFASEIDHIANLCHGHGISVADIKRDELICRMSDEHADDFDSGFIISMLRLCDLLDIGAWRVTKFEQLKDKANAFYQATNGVIKSVQVSESRHARSCISIDNPNNNSTGNKNFTCVRMEKEIRITFDRAYQFDAGVSEQEVYAYLLKYISDIETEIVNMYDLIKTDSLRPRIKKTVATPDFNKEFIKVKADEDFLLSMVASKKLYPSEKVAIRELLQNAIDACRARSEISFDRDGYVFISYSIKNVGEQRIAEFTIVDHGAGMTKEIIENYYINAGKSLYKSQQYKYSDKQFYHAGNFGIGVFSVFMLTDEIEVRTHRVLNHKEIVFKLRNGSHWVELKTQNATDICGTAIRFESSILPDVFQDVDELEQYIRRTFLLVNQNKGIKFYITDKDISNRTVTDLMRAANENDFKEIKLCDAENLAEAWARDCPNDLFKINLKDILMNIEGKIYIEKKNVNCLFDLYYDSRENKFTETPFVNAASVIVIKINCDKGDNTSDIKRLIIKTEDWTGIPITSSTEQSYGHLEFPILDNINLIDLCDLSSYERNEASIYAAYFNGDRVTSSDGCYFSGCTICNRQYFLHGIHVEGAQMPIVVPNSDQYRLIFAIINICDETTIPVLNRDKFEESTAHEIQAALEFAVKKYLNENLEENFVLETERTTNNKYIIKG